MRDACDSCYAYNSLSFSASQPVTSGLFRRCWNHRLAPCPNLPTKLNPKTLIMLFACVPFFTYTCLRKYLRHLCVPRLLRNKRPQPKVHIVRVTFFIPYHTTHILFSYGYEQRRWVTHRWKEATFGQSEATYRSAILFEEVRVNAFEPCLLKVTRKRRVLSSLFFPFCSPPLLLPWLLGLITYARDLTRQTR